MKTQLETARREAELSRVDAEDARAEAEKAKLRAGTLAEFVTKLEAGYLTRNFPDGGVVRSRVREDEQ